MPESVKRRGSSGPTTGAMLGLWSGVVATGREGYGRAVQLLLAMVLLMWALEVVDTALDNQLDQGGIIPREAEGLDGVIAAPFLHVGFGHLIANTLPFVAMGLVIGLEGPLRLLGVTAIVGVISGLGTWLIAPADTIHLGASGVVFGYATYLLARGLFNRRPVEIAIGAVVAVLWGGRPTGAPAPARGVCWGGPPVRGRCPPPRGGGPGGGRRARGGMTGGVRAAVGGAAPGVPPPKRPPGGGGAT